MVVRGGRTARGIEIQRVRDGEGRRVSEVPGVNRLVVIEPRQNVQWQALRLRRVRSDRALGRGSTRRNVDLPGPDGRCEDVRKAGCGGRAARTLALRALAAGGHDEGRHQQPYEPPHGASRLQPSFFQKHRGSLGPHGTHSRGTWRRTAIRRRPPPSHRSRDRGPPWPIDPTGKRDHGPAQPRVPPPTRSTRATPRQRRRQWYRFSPTRLQEPSSHVEVMETRGLGREPSTATLPSPLGCVANGR